MALSLVSILRQYQEVNFRRFWLLASVSRYDSVIVDTATQ